MYLSGDKSGWECIFFLSLYCISLTVSLQVGKLQELSDILKLLQGCLSQHP